MLLKENDPNKRIQFILKVVYNSFFSVNSKEKQIFNSFKNV